MLVRQNELKALVDELRAQGQTIVTTNGCFDILHAGHVKYLEKTALGFRLQLINRGSVKRELIKLGWPVKDEAPLVDGEVLDMLIMWYYLNRIRRLTCWK